MNAPNGIGTDEAEWFIGTVENDLLLSKGGDDIIEPWCW